MVRRRPNPRLVKIHRNYTVEEAARVLGTHKHTIRNWLKEGLEAIDGRRPTLIHGQTLAEFIRARRRPKKRCAPGEMYCIRCRAPKKPAGGIADYLPITDTSGNLRGICPDCDLLIHRRVSLSRLDAVRGGIEVAVPQAERRIGERSSPCVDCDLEEAAESR